MIETGTTFTTDSGNKLRVESLLQQGGQGTAYIVKETRSGDKGVLKIFADSFDRRDTAMRVRFLVKEKLHEACPLFATPLDSLTRQSALAGHYCRLAPGLPLDQHLASIRCGFLENLVLAIALAHAVETLHGRNIVHGDLQASNLLVEQVEGRSGLASLSLIDLDNFYAPGQPQPPCVGHSLYMAPELYHAMKQKRPTIPTRPSDLFSLGVLMHEIILLKHPAAGCDHNEAQFEQAMYAGSWPLDPARSERNRSDTGGYPAEIVNADLARLFRKSFSLEAAERPSASEWKKTLCKALREVFLCPVCHNPCLVDSSKQACPCCRADYPALQLVTGDGIAISLDFAAIPVGRESLGGYPQISVHHATFRRLGPETWIEAYGSNGTFRKAGCDWIRLPDDKPILLREGDRLKFADLECRLVRM